MAKKLIPSPEVKASKKKFRIEAPLFKIPEEILDQESIEEVASPSIEDIQKEIEEIRKKADEEIRLKRKQLEEESQKIIEDAESKAFERLNQTRKEEEEIVGKGKNKASEITQKAEEKARQIVEEGESQRNAIIDESREKGYEEGMAKALEEGKTQIQRIVGRLEKVLGEAIYKRREIVESSERQLIDMVMTIARKVVKTVSERDKRLVLRTVIDALRWVKGVGKITIRVNIDDLEIASRYRDEFHRSLDHIEGVRVLEDPSVDKGGCIIETDFGTVDARIASQLEEIENAVRKVEPVIEK